MRRGNIVEAYQETAQILEPATVRDQWQFRLDTCGDVLFNPIPSAGEPFKGEKSLTLDEWPVVVGGPDVKTRIARDARQLSHGGHDATRCAIFQYGPPWCLQCSVAINLAKTERLNSFGLTERRRSVGPKLSDWAGSLRSLRLISPTQCQWVSAESHSMTGRLNQHNWEWELRSAQLLKPQ